MDLFALSLPIEAVGQQQASQAIQTVERQGHRAAVTYTAVWRQAGSGVNASLRQTEQVARTTNAGIATSAVSMSKRYATAAFQIAGVATAIAATGDATQSQMTRLIGLASGIAFAFGPTGAIVGAIGLSLLAIRQMFERTNAEMEKTKANAIQAVREIFEETDAKAAASRRTRIEKDLFDAQQQLLREQDAVFQIAQRARHFFPPGTSDLDIAAGTRVNGQISPSVQAVRDLTKKIDELKNQLVANTTVLKTLSVKGVDVLSPLSSLVGGNAASDEARVRAAVARRAGTAGLRRGDFGQGAAGIAGRNQAGIQQSIAASLSNPAVAALAETEQVVSDAVDRYITGGIGDALVNGFSRAFSGEGLGGLFKGFGASILSSLGGFFIELGTHLIKFGSLMEWLKRHLTSWLGAGIGSIAVGVGLIALGSLMSAGGSALGSSPLSAVYGGGTGVGTRSLTDRVGSFSLNPQTLDVTSLDRTNMRPVGPFYIFGRDATTERQITAAVKRELRRGGSL